MSVTPAASHTRVPAGTVPLKIRRSAGCRGSGWRIYERRVHVLVVISYVEVDAPLVKITCFLNFLLRRCYIVLVALHWAQQYRQVNRVTFSFLRQTEF